MHNRLETQAGQLVDIYWDGSEIVVEARNTDGEPVRDDTYTVDESEEIIRRFSAAITNARLAQAQQAIEVAVQVAKTVAVPVEVAHRLIDTGVVDPKTVLAKQTDPT